MERKSGYNTGLAAEFHVLSILHRLGFSASLTLGNRKSVDIVVESRNRIRFVDVKGLAGKTIWALDNFHPMGTGHFVALVSFLNQIGEPDSPPEVYVLPDSKVETHLYPNPKGTRKGIKYREMRDNGAQYRNAWRQLG